MYSLTCNSSMKIPYYYLLIEDISTKKSTRRMLSLQMLHPVTNYNKRTVKRGKKFIKPAICS